jgi:hypothetical protein
MRRGRLLALILTLASCGPAAERAPSPHEQLIAEQQRVRPGGTSPCHGDGLIFYSNGQGVQGIMIAYPPGDCDALEPAEVIQGMWYAGFEEDGFVEGAERVPPVRDVTMRSIAGPPDPTLLIDRREPAFRPRGPGTRAVRVAFVGRRNAPYRGPDGREGWPFIVVDRLLWTEDLGEVITRWDCREFPRRLTGEGTCIPGTERQAR